MFHQIVRHISVSRNMLYVHSCKHIYTRELDLNSSYFIPQKPKSGKQIQYKLYVKEHRRGCNWGLLHQPAGPQFQQ